MESKRKMLVNNKFMMVVPVLGYEGYYSISISGEITNENTGKIMALRNSELGYKSIILSKNGVKKGHWVHRLVLSSFDGHVLPGMVVDHKDNNPRNNHLSNLRWLTQKENITRPWKEGRRSSKNTGKSNRAGNFNPRSKSVVGIDDDGEVIFEFESVSAAIKAGYSAISQRLYGKNKDKKSYGLYWQFR